ncbi:TetR/AcrR family transcriptional regulator [Salinicola aestuarinus]|uniref:TetR/AcrR family transcriptional regulator n=1 Tax=Salinicola aestuarinus TaxID=1949082 RepID=UPI00165EC20C|nr:TetR/AcrR family transcriptional regulator [Salinicola aestuarinus]
MSDSPLPRSFTPPLSPTTQRGRKRHDALLEAAQRLFLERGFSQVSVNDIVAEAGGSLSTLYRHFGNKEGLFQAMVEHRSHDIYTALTADDIDSLPVEAALTRFGSGLLHKAMDDEALGIYREVVAESPRQPELARRFFDAGPGRMRQVVKEYLDRRVADRSLPPVDTAALAGMYLGMVLGEWHLIQLLQLEAPPSAEAIDARVTRCATLFLGGLRDAPD